jgi:hypothetical protein
MFETRSAEIADAAAAAAVGACWAQWAALGAPVASAGRPLPSSLIDIEALVILSARAAERERRLLDLVAWWARVGSALTSVQRFGSLVDAFPPSTRAGALVFAALAEAAGDRRWSRHVDRGAELPTVRDKGVDAPSLAGECALWLRLRAGLGVGAKADTIAYLLGTHDAWASVRDISRATGYSTVAIRTATSEMVIAGFIRTTGDRPARFAAPSASWAGLLALAGEPRVAPRWHAWSEIFAFLLGVGEWAAAVAAPDPPGRHVLASRARDQMERYSTAFALDRIAVPDPAAFPGLEAVAGLAETVRVVAAWVEEQL